MFFINEKFRAATSLCIQSVLPFSCYCHSLSNRVLFVPLAISLSISWVFFLTQSTRLYSCLNLIPFLGSHSRIDRQKITRFLITTPTPHARLLKSSQSKHGVINGDGTRRSGHQLRLRRATHCHRRSGPRRARAARRGNGDGVVDGKQRQPSDRRRGVDNNLHAPGVLRVRLPDHAHGRQVSDLDQRAGALARVAGDRLLPFAMGRRLQLPRGLLELRRPRHESPGVSLRLGHPER